MKWPERKEYDERTMGKSDYYGSLDDAKRLGWNACLEACKAAYEKEPKLVALDESDIQLICNAIMSHLASLSYGQGDSRVISPDNWGKFYEILKLDFISKFGIKYKPTCNHIFTRTLIGNKVYCNGCNTNITEIQFWYMRGYDMCASNKGEMISIKSIDELAKNIAPNSSAGRFYKEIKRLSIKENDSRMGTPSLPTVEEIEELICKSDIHSAAWKYYDLNDEDMNGYKQDTLLLAQAIVKRLEDGK